MGSNRDDTRGAAPGGVAYVYAGSGDTWWVQQVRLVPDYPQLDWQFGYQVAVWGDTLAIGGLGRSRRAPGGVRAQGAVHMYRRLNGNSWSPTADLRMPRPMLIALGLGSNGSLALRNGTLLASAQGASLNKGAIFVYRSSDGGVTWNLNQRLQASDAQSGAFGLGEATVFGVAVAFDGTSLVAGSRLAANTLGNGTVVEQWGAVYVFESQ